MVLLARAQFVPVFPTLGEAMFCSTPSRVHIPNTVACQVLITASAWFMIQQSPVLNLLRSVPKHGKLINRSLHSCRSQNPEKYNNIITPKEGNVPCFTRIGYNWFFSSSFVVAAAECFRQCDTEFWLYFLTIKDFGNDSICVHKICIL